MGSYAVEYITASSQALRGYYEISVSIRYRRTAQQVQAVVNATSVAALPELLTAALGEGKTELAVRKLAGKLDMSESDIHRQLQKGDSLAFEETALYKNVYKLAEAKTGKTLPREMLPGIQLESPKITRNLTTAWFAKRVDERRAKCMGQSSL